MSDALTTLDLTDDPEGIDETIAQALTDLNAAVKQVRAFKQAPAAGVESTACRLPDRRRHDPRAGRSVHPVRGDYPGGLRPPRGRNLGLRSPGGGRRGRVRGRGRRSARCRVEVRPPVADLVISRSLAYPFTRSKWADSLAAAEAEAGQAIEDAANPLAEEPAAGTTRARRCGLSRRAGSPGPASRQ